MADEEAPPPAPPASEPAPAPEAEQTITLLAYADVQGEQRPKGKVLAVPASEAARLIAAGLAREATENDRRFAGLI